MSICLTRRGLALLGALLPLLASPAGAQEGTAGDGAVPAPPAADATAAEEAAPASSAPAALAPVAAGEVDEAAELYRRRPVIVFADSPADPSFVRQMDLLTRYLPELAQRDVILITDTAPAEPSALRRRLRPRGFTLVLMDKDWGAVIRKPLPWEGREIINAIDKMPITRSEALEKSPSGR